MNLCTSCLVGDPEPEVTFHKDGKQINPRKNKRAKIDWDLDTDVTILSIKDATNEDAGEYMIRAENDKGGFQFTINVIIGKASEMEVVESTKSWTVTEEKVVEGGVVESVITEAKTVEKTVGGEMKIESSVSETKLVDGVEVKAIEEETKSAVTEEEVEAVESIEVSASVEESKVEEVTVEGDEEVEEAEDGAPTVEVAPEPVCVKVGEQIRLSCKVTG